MTFIVRVEKYLKDAFSEQVSSLSDDELGKRIREGIQRAQSYKFESEADVVRFIDLQWRMGENFDTDLEKYPWVELLSESGITPAEKVALIRDGYAMYLAGQDGENT